MAEVTLKGELPDIELRHQLADSMAMLTVKNPRDFNGVTHTDNTSGCILSYISGRLVGSLGQRPSASISGIPGQGKCNGIYEPVRVGVLLVLPVKALLTQSPGFLYLAMLPR